MTSQQVIFWFREDLRLTDNPALVEAAKAGSILPLYIFDTNPKNPKPMGAASKWWLKKSLEALQQQGVPLLIQQGNPVTILKRLLEVAPFQGIYWNRTYTPYDIERDKEIKLSLEGCRSFNGALLHEPWTVSNLKGDYYRVFTPFWKKCLTLETRDVLDKPSIDYVTKFTTEVKNISLNDILPHSSWASKFEHHWEPGEQGAQQTLRFFIEKKLNEYKKNRDIPHLSNTSRLSPHLHFGNISPHQILKETQNIQCADPNDLYAFHSELGWREFCFSLLYHAPHVCQHPFQEKFKNLPWAADSPFLKPWKRGKTGYPIIDAGMRELWETGYMHNRVRMIVASFLTKHCLIHWKAGESHFWETLVDADMANNVLNWQWVAGCGADAAPYFRIFNPITQSKKFDPDGLYIRQWVPELKSLSNKQVHTPWMLSTAQQEELNCIIGQDYPAPILDLDEGRKKALEAYKEL